MRPLQKENSAFTLSELLVSSSLSLVMVAVGLLASISIQRSFNASIRYSNSQSEQVRVLDYMAMDLRRALTVTPGSGELIITVPDYYNASGLPNMPALVNGSVRYGNAPVAVRYHMSGTSIFRESQGTSTLIAENVGDFQFTFTENGQVIEISISFLPTFRQQNQDTASRAGTKTTIRTLLRNRRAI